MLTELLERNIHQMSCSAAEWVFKGGAGQFTLQWKKSSQRVNLTVARHRGVYVDRGSLKTVKETTMHGECDNAISAPNTAQKPDRHWLSLDGGSDADTDTSNQHNGTFISQNKQTLSILLRIWKPCAHRQQSPSLVISISTVCVYS